MKTTAHPQHPPPGDFRLFLQEELARRCQANPRYSLRAFAKFLGVEPSFLSKLLRGQRAVTKPVLESFSRKLALAPETRERFQDSLGHGAAVPFQSLTHDHYRMIAEWHHYAILELTLIPGFELEAPRAARTLGISAAEATAAIERLARLGMLERDPTGAWRNASGNNTTTANEFTAAAFRQLQRGILEKAIQALEDTPWEERDQTSLTMAMDSRLLPELKSMTKEFRREVARLQLQSTHRDQVYHLSFSCYPVMKSKTKKLEKNL